MRLDLGERLLLNRSHNNFIPLRARRIEHEERELAIAGDEAKLFGLHGHEVDADSHGRRVSLALRITENSYAPGFGAEAFDRYNALIFLIRGFVQLLFYLGGRLMIKEHRQCMLMSQPSCAPCR